MTHELKEIVRQVILNQKNAYKSVLATVVELDGSSYRGPGVRMLLTETGEMTGAVSGGCVEKEIQRQAETVFTTGKAHIMTYDGRYRLGCEGMLYILIEPIKITDAFLEDFSSCLLQRNGFSIQTYYNKKEGAQGHFGSVVKFGKDQIHRLSDTFDEASSKDLKVFEQLMDPCFRLWLIGGEHDAVKLSYLALGLGWEVAVSTVPSEDKQILDFPGVDTFWNVIPENLPVDDIDEQTAVVLMTHSYVKDLKYLKVLRKTKPMYFGLLGPSKRREKLFGEYMELYPDDDFEIFEQIYGPAGLNIGAEAPEEIAIAILAEILTVIRNQEPMLLRNKKQGIHN